MRVKSSTTTRSKRKKLVKGTKGMIRSRRASVRRAKEAITKAEVYAYRDRKVKKRTLRGVWITRLNAAVRAEGMSYSRFINALKTAKVELDRKVLAEMAVKHPESLKKLIEEVSKTS